MTFWPSQSNPKGFAKYPDGRVVFNRYAIERAISEGNLDELLQHALADRQKGQDDNGVLEKQKSDAALDADTTGPDEAKGATPEEVDRLRQTLKGGKNATHG